MRNKRSIRAVSIAIAIIAALILTACGGGRSAHKRNSERKVVHALKTQYASWKGVRYKMGGLSKRGVDCSGFVQRTFKDRFGKSIPRTTKALASAGKQISKKRLRPGDLVFFKTGWNVRHVGIYYGNNKFLHASTSEGVTITSLSNSYWKKKYWQSRRILK